MPYLRFRRARFLAVSLLLLLTGTRAWGQFFVADGAPCPGGDNVTLDTLSYSPDKAMPFDRCFYLKVTLPGNQSVTAFGITPIDKKGNPKSSRRDYRVFLRSELPTARARKDERETHPFSIFKHEPIKREFTGVTTTFNGRKTEAVLRMPPLEPGREYRIILIGDDPVAFKEVMKISDLIIRSHRDNNAQLAADAKRLHMASLTKSNNRAIGLRQIEFNLYEELLTSFDLLFNINKGGAEKSYRVFFSPTSSPITSVDEARAMPNGLSVPIPNANSPHTEHFKLPLPTFRKDTVRQDTVETIKIYQDWIEPHEVGTPDNPGNYLVQVLTFYREDIDPPIPPTLTNLGELVILEKGTKYTFTPNPIIADSVYAEFSNHPLNQFESIEAAEDSLRKLETMPDACLELTALQFLLTQAARCPCEEKGIKDLTQKDGLMRAISSLHRNDLGVMQSIWQGLLSLDALAATAVKPAEYAARIANLNNSQKRLNDLIEFADKEATYHLAQERAVRGLIRCLETWQGGMQLTIDQLEAIIKAQGKLKSMLTGPLGLRQARPLAIGSTTALNLLSDTKFRIMPDFGFVALFKGDKLYTFQDFTPYLGFQVGLRSMDKNIPFRMIRYKSIWHRLSVMSGVTLRSLKIESQREDFFGSTSLITGIGFRLSSYVRVTGGAVWFKAVDPNRLTNNKPIRFSPFAGISIDLDVQELFGGITKLFK